ncbi:diacylglycerol kinase family protein [Corynebacterium sp. 5QC2CO]|uniref:diacylglycerol/lipid kinase family protein n=1 Tax=Corynebacterium sp. 5QC2CO TaxID=2968468 RepID=UPI00211BCAD7|nr:diacylglycerol kinase [Corynebacterium sp. 5QC2CO]
MRALLISNPNSTSNTARRMPGVVRALRSVEGIRLTSMFTAYPGHAAEMVAGKTVRDYDVIISLGGDGTINEIVNGLMNSNPFSALPATELPAIAAIPTGSANVLAGALGIPRDPVDAAWYIASLLRSRTRSTISVGHAAERCFVVNAGIGIDAEVISTMEQLRQNGTRAKAVRYLPAIFTAWNQLRKSPPQITATIDGTEFGRDLAMAVVSNSNPWTFLGDLPIVTNPTVSLRRGLGFYGFTSLRGVTGLVAAANLAGFFTRLRSPFHIEARERRVDNVQHIELTATAPLRLQLDGEYINQCESLNIRVKQGAINFVARADDYTEDQFTKKVATRPVDERLLVVVTKKVMDRTRRLFSTRACLLYA